MFGVRVRSLAREHWAPWTITAHWATHTADTNTIRAAYRALAKQYHPDVSKLPDAHERFVALTQAYEILSDPVARDRYDRTRASPSPKRASPATEARYSRATEARQRAARTHAEEYGRMRYAQFDADLFDSAAGYLAPKMLGCVGFGAVGIAAIVLLLGIGSVLDSWVMVPIIVLAFFGLIPGLAYASTWFDEWHNQQQAERNKRKR